MTINAGRILLCFFITVCAGCANITAPTGGKKDIAPPKLREIDPSDSLLNTKVKRIDLDFDEYITVSDVSKEVELSPILSIAPAVTSNNKHVVVKIVDTLLEENTTYRLSFGKAIKDLHEGNPFAGYTYTFSTGAYFDSLQLRGTVINAATGLADTGGVLVVLYSAKDNDSAIVRHKPKYVAKADATGAFIFKGLPGRSFRIYALKDANNNLVYDGAIDNEMIAFNDAPVTPSETPTKKATADMQQPVLLRMFTEIVDTSVKKSTDSVSKDGGGFKGRNKKNTGGGPAYSVNIDTSNAIHRTFDITHPVNLVFSAPPQLNQNKISLSYDSAGTTITPPLVIAADTAHPLTMHIFPGYPGEMAWEQDRVYTLRLAKGFAKDTAGKDLMPSKYVFHTTEDEDYGILHIHLPAKYSSSLYLLMVTVEKDTIYYKPVSDTLISLSRLRPGKYTCRIVVDKNRNGKWDTGDLFGKIQPEEVIPYKDVTALKAGWEYTIDFEQQPIPKNNGGKDNVKPGDTK